MRAQGQKHSQRRGLGLVFKMWPLLQMLDLNSPKPSSLKLPDWAAPKPLLENYSAFLCGCHLSAIYIFKTVFGQQLQWSGCPDL